MASFLFWAALLVAAFSRADSAGLPASIYEFPSIVQVEIGLPGVIWTQQCAGTVITSFHIVSIASCFGGSVETRRIRAGTDIRSTGGILSYVMSANNYPDPAADISVVTLLTQLPLGDTIAQIPIITQDFGLPVGLPVRLIGWGTTAEGGEVSSSQLYRLDLVITDPAGCAAKYEGDFEVNEENQICLGLSLDSGRDYDARDMGDPVHYQNILVGLLAYGKRDANDEYPIITTAISQYTSWIIANAV